MFVKEFPGIGAIIRNNKNVYKIIGELKREYSSYYTFNSEVVSSAEYARGDIVICGWDKINTFWILVAPAKKIRNIPKEPV